MGDLTGSTISSTYNLLLTTESAVMGSSLQSIQSGTGVSSALKLSTSVVSVNGTLEINSPPGASGGELHISSPAGSDTATITLQDTDTDGEPYTHIYQQGGIFRINADNDSDTDESTIILNTGGINRLTINNDGNVGIGAIYSPAQNLHIDNGATGEGDHAYLLFTTGDTGSTASDGLTVGYAASNYAVINNREETDLVFATSGDNQMTIDKDGNVGIGEENPSQIVDIKGTDTNARLQVTNSDSSSLVLGYAGTTDAVLSNLADGAFIFGTSDETQMIIDEEGSVGIGLGDDVTVVPGSFKQYVKADENVLAICVNNNTESASTYFPAVTFKKRQYNTADTILEPGYINVKDSGIFVGGTSDYRLKENDTPIADGIDRLNLLRPIKFNFKSDPSNVIDGFFAHEVSEVCANAVYREKDEVGEGGEIVPQGLDVSKLVPLLTAALKETLAKVESLEARVAQLEGSA